MEENLNYKILGESAQVLEINLEPDHTLIADGGALLYLDEEIHFETREDDGADEIDSSIENDDFEEDFFQDNDDNPLSGPEFEEFEEKDVQGSLLEKLWVATKKAIQKVPLPKVKKKEDSSDNLPEFPQDMLPEEEEELSFEKEPPFSWYITHFTNQSEYIRKIAFTTSNSGMVLAIDLNELFDNELVIQSGRFLCSRKGVHLEKHLDTGIPLNFTKEKFYNLDKLSGKHEVFLQAEGHIVEKSLGSDSIWINLFSLIAFESSLTLNVHNIKKVQSMNYEDDLIFVLLSGSGKYWVQTANLQHLVYRISPFMFESPATDGTPDMMNQGFDFGNEGQNFNNPVFEDGDDD